MLLNFSSQMVTNMTWPLAFKEHSHGVIIPMPRLFEELSSTIFSMNCSVTFEVFPRAAGHHTLINCDDQRDESVKGKWDELQSFEADELAAKKHSANIISDSPK